MDASAPVRLRDNRLATVHFFMQSKLDITQPIIMAGIFRFCLPIESRRAGVAICRLCKRPGSPSRLLSRPHLAKPFGMPFHMTRH